ncbi:hypothetical protein BJY04DRAFT_2875 [Aspergillus karnatakaensis]|uniref:uncharacterized protein n=1 Tax=Aspergillus karnatakaensis TaxID=1810916 RepID=UPI003CCCA821
MTDLTAPPPGTYSDYILRPMNWSDFIMVLDHFGHQVNSNSVPTVTQPLSSRPRKKFAKPPVKSACLACRASRTRCDGQEPCLNCLGKKRKCVYVASKRGGPRKKKKPSVPVEGTVQRDDVENTAITSVTPEFEESTLFGQIDVLSASGAGLRNLDMHPDVQHMFAGLLDSPSNGNAHVQMEPTPSSSSMSSSQTVVRTYGSEHEILNAYYDFIHDYFPILPPRVAPASVDKPFEGVGSFSEFPSEEPIIAYKPRSPLSLAISAVLALIPHPNDLDPTSESSSLRRRTYAQAFTQMANASIESDCELHASPANPFESNRPVINRGPFHPRAPVELESLLALLVLSVYEYTQRGNLLKMRYRAEQAMAIALDMSLHSLGEEYDDLAEARRRAWWMTYYCVLQGSIVSTTVLQIKANDPQFVTPYPRFSADPDGWSILIQSQQLLVAATQFVIDLKQCLPTSVNMPCVFETMQQLDTWASAILAQSSLPALVPRSADGHGVTEHTTAQSVRAIAQIKLSSAQIKIHRFRAFSDIPIFLQRHCDLTAANSTNPASGSAADGSESPGEITNVGCSCSGLENFQQSSSGYATSSTSSTSSEFQTIPQYSFISEFPYTSQHSARVCLRASLLISRMFQNLPIPQPLNDASNSPRVLQFLPQNQYPRTMPSFACCMMQGSYALLMVFYKMSVENHVPTEMGTGLDSRPSGTLTDELRQGLERIITAVTNYTVAFEALDGMREDIQGAYHTAFLQG